MQKQRFFEELSAKYWNQSLTKECSRSEDQEGISLESLGGVFIATLFGLILAMITLAAEVLYYKKKHTFKTSLTKIITVREASPTKKIEMKKNNFPPPPSFKEATFGERKFPKEIAFGKTGFQPQKIFDAAYQEKLLQLQNKMEDTL